MGETLTPDEFSDKVRKEPLKPYLRYGKKQRKPLLERPEFRRKIVKNEQRAVYHQI